MVVFHRKEDYEDNIELQQRLSLFPKDVTRDFRAPRTSKRTFERFRQLPPEIRRMIYGHYLNFRVTWHKHKPHPSLAPSTPYDQFKKFNALALLATSRAIRDEIGLNWERNITLFFDNTDVMKRAIEYGSIGVPLKRIRNIEIADVNVMYDDRDEDTFAFELRVLHSYFSQMNLDRLTLSLQWYKFEDLKLVFALAKSGVGWKNIEIVTRRCKYLSPSASKHRRYVHSNGRYPTCMRCSWNSRTDPAGVCQALSKLDDGKPVDMVVYTKPGCYTRHWERHDRSTWKAHLGKGQTSTDLKHLNQALDEVTDEDLVYAFYRRTCSRMNKW
ncbi:hypothetical protein BJ166DRAFT_592489 [Pestalotiopsis sp. NC0098]|nr:hypothetical protein BJ166DRAFT_592489 [Pestalotiopsis sp. NC0098]